MIKIGKMKMTFDFVETIKTTKISKIIVLSLIILSGCFFLFHNLQNDRSNLFQYIEDLSQNSDEINLHNNANHSGIDNWIVITTISFPTEDIKKLADMTNWTLVIVADKKTPNNWTYKNCVFLSVEIQRNLKYAILELLPYNSYTRKMVGYLYAIEHGAKFIYDTDDDNLPVNLGLKLFDYKNITSGMIRLNSTLDGHEFYNAYSHFGQPEVWPRGYPLELINEKSQLYCKLCHKMKTPVIQQGLVNQDADVDAIYRMVFVKDKDKGLNIKFDQTAPPIILGENVYCPFNSQNTLFHYEAFWGLLLPITVAFRVTDIWRGYWTQRLLHLSANYLGFYGPNARQKRNPHSYFKDFLDENQLYNDAATLVQALQLWQCAGNDFATCIIDLSELMVRKNFWGLNDLKLTKAWINDLYKVGYHFPDIPRKDENSTKVDSCRFADFVSNVKKQVDIETVHTDFVRKLNNLCSTVTSSKFYSSGLTVNPFNHTKNVILVIVINRQDFFQIPLLRVLYEPWFSNVIFCAAYPSNFRSVESSYPSLFKNVNPNSKFSYVNLTDEELNSGNFGYLCLNKIIDMKISNVDGYMTIADDMLFNFWNRINPDRLSYISTCEINDGWAGWSNNPGTTAAIKRLSDYFQTNPSPLGNLDPKIELSLRDTLMKRVICMADTFYIPFDLSDQYRYVSQIFFDHRTMLEIAVVRIMYSLGWANNITFNEVPKFNDSDTILYGRYLWYDDRVNPFRFYKESDHFLHPIKMSTFTDPKALKPFCEIYLKDLMKSINVIQMGFNKTV